MDCSIHHNVGMVSDIAKRPRLECSPGMCKTKRPETSELSPPHISQPISDMELTNQPTSATEPTAQVKSNTEPAAQITSGTEPTAQVTSDTEPAAQEAFDIEPAAQETSVAVPTNESNRHIQAELIDEYSHLPQGPLCTNEPCQPEFGEFDEFLKSFMKEQHIPGLSLAISRHGRPLYTQCYGYASHKTPLRHHHMFRIASVTKILTSVAVLRLYEKNILKLNDKVFGPKGILKQYSPAVSGDRRMLRITVRHLLAHSAGWDREIVGDAVFWKHVGEEMNVPEPVPNDVLIRYMMGQKLQFTPGSRYAYSNLGYIVLGRVIEQCSGQTYEGYIQGLLQEIRVTKMQLGRTFRHQAHSDEVEYFPSPEYREVESIYPGLGKVSAPYGSYSMETGDADGGWIACPTDLITIMQAVEGVGEYRLLKPDTFRLMLERPSYGKGSCWYGLGLDVSWYRKSWEHGGHVDGATSCVTRNKDGITWAILCNYWPSDSDYTSLISYAITKVAGCTKLKTLSVKYADAATLDGKYCVNVKLGEEEYMNYYDIHVGRGYRVSWFDAYQMRNVTNINVIWVKDDKKGLCYHNVTPILFRRTVEEAIDKGFVPIHVDSYFSSAKSDKNNSIDIAQGLRFAIVFVEGVEEYVLQHDVLYEDLTAQIERLKSQGYYIQCQSPYYIAAQCYVAVLYTKSTSKTRWPKPRISLDKYQGEFDRQVRYGHLPSYLKFYKEDTTIYVSAIWSDTGPYLYTAEHDMSKYRVLTDLLLVSQNKFYPLCICGYEDDAAHKYAVVCVKQVPPKK